MRAAALFAFLLLPAMDADANDDAPKPLMQVFQGLSARENWRQNPHAHYRYVLHRRCYCPAPNDVRVEVANGRVTNVTDLKSGKDLPPARLSGYASIDELIARIDAAVARKPDSMRVEYDRHMGYPKRVHIDPSYRIADDEIDFTIESVTLL